MHRNPAALAEREFDVLVVGGGAAGAAAAREASLRGYSTALIEREDFGAGSSAQCFKVVHGGIRYLQHADFGRLRASCRERSIFLRIAPHLVAPLPFAIPTYGHGRSGKWLLRAGMRAYDLATIDRNRGLPDPARRIARTRFLGRAETLASFPSLERHGLTGAAVFEDGQMYNPPRLVLAFVAAAFELGAVVANYVEAERLLVEGGRVNGEQVSGGPANSRRANGGQQLTGGRVIGVRARDRLSGESFDIRARVTINAAGPWAEGLLRAGAAESDAAEPAAGEIALLDEGTYSRDACFVVAREPPPMALAVQGATRDQDALFARAARHLFLVPWRGYTLVGVWHTVVPRDPDAAQLSRAELARFVEEINAAHPALRLQMSEVREVCYGLVPFGDAARQLPGALSFGKESRLIDHRRQGLAGLVTAISVRYTVARRDAVAALNLAGSQLEDGRSSRTFIPPRGRDPRRNGNSAPAARRPRRDRDASATRPLPGGDIDDFNRFARGLARSFAGGLPEAALDALARNHGTEAGRVIAVAAEDPVLRRCLAGTTVLGAEIAYAVREEMARRLTDIVFRRTELGTAGHPGEQALAEAEAIMRRELGWSAQQAAEERAATARHFARYLADPPSSSPTVRAPAENGSAAVLSFASAAVRRA